MTPTIPFEISVQELHTWMNSTKVFKLIDVREPAEREIANIGGELIPLAGLPHRFKELDAQSDIIVYCRSGARSGMAVEFLRRNGFERARNLRGGILAWSREIDPDIPQY